jgi:predicted GNAT family acetyltransferase
MIDVRHWDPEDVGATVEFERVIELHRQSKATLGPLPFAAFEEAGRRRRLILGAVDGQIGGYVLYGTPRHHTVKLVHVTVDRALRKSGLAKAMVEFAIESHPDRSTITAHCRADYGVDGFWRSLDMTPSSERAGRARAGSTLTIWTRRIGPRDLLEDALYSSTRPLAVLDSNVIIDLYASETVERHDRQESLGLAEDWLSDLIERSYSPEVNVDVNRFPIVAERGRIRNALAEMVPVRRDPGMAVFARELLERMPGDLVAQDASLTGDAKHLADAILAGADYFVTRDENLLQATGGWAHEEFSIEVLRPVTLLQRLFPDPGLSQFRSDALESVGLSWVRQTSVTQDLVEAFLQYRVNEKSTFFQKRLQAVLAHPANADLEVLSDAQGRFWALVGVEVKDSTLTVPVLRVGRGRLGSTISFQLIRHLRQLAVRRGASSVSVLDDNLDPVVSGALEVDGFLGTPAAATIAAHPDPSLVGDLSSPSEVAAYEATNWPQLLLDRQVPVWLVPIQPAYARNLIGYNDTLLAGRESQALGLAREFVYFSSPKVKNWQAPARVIWYATKDEGLPERTAVRAAVGHSWIAASTVVDVETAIEQYRSLGTLKEREIRKHGVSGEVLVIRFENTQLLPTPVARSRFNALLKKHGVAPPIQTARSVPAMLFDDLVRMQPGFEAR